MKWLVTWVLLQSFPTSCPIPAMQPNDYGIENRLTTQTLQICYEETEKHLSRLFDSKEAAERFIEQGKKECLNQWDCSLQDWELKQVEEGVE